MFKDFKYPFIITICFFIFFILVYITLLGKQFTIDIGDINSDIKTSEFEIAAFDLMNNYYEYDSRISDIRQFPSSGFYLTVKKTPYVHKQDMCLSGTIKTQDDWQLYYNSSYSDPVFRQYLRNRQPITLYDNLYLYSKDNQCKTLSECLTLENLNYLEIPSEYLHSYKEDLINKPDTEALNTQVSVTNNTNLCGETMLYAYLQKKSFVKFSTEMSNSKDSEKISIELKIHNILNPTIKHSVLEFGGSDISISTEEINNFEEGWYTIGILPSETSAETCIRKIKSNAVYSTTEKMTTIGSKTTFYSKISRNSKLVLYPEIDLKEELTVKINNSKYLLTKQHSPQNPLIIDIIPGDIIIEIPAFPITLLGVNLAPNKNVFGTPYKINFFQESFAGYSIDPDIVISPLKQNQEDFVLCLTTRFYTIFNKSGNHLFEFRNLDLSNDLQEFQRLQEYNFYRNSLNPNTDIWTSIPKYEESVNNQNQEVYINTLLKNLPLDLHGNIVNSDIYDYSEFKILLKRSSSASVFQNISLYRK